MRGSGRLGLTSVNTTDSVKRGGNEGDPTVRTGSLAQRSVLMGVGRNSREEGIYVHVQLVHFAARQNWHNSVKHIHANEKSTVPHAHKQTNTLTR